MVAALNLYFAFSLTVKTNLIYRSIVYLKALRNIIECLFYCIPEHHSLVKQCHRRWRLYTEHTQKNGAVSKELILIPHHSFVYVLYMTTFCAQQHGKRHACIYVSTDTNSDYRKLLSKWLTNVCRYICTVMSVTRN